MLSQYQHFAENAAPLHENINDCFPVNVQRVRACIVVVVDVSSECMRRKNTQQNPLFSGGAGHVSPKSTVISCGEEAPGGELESLGRTRATTNKNESSSHDNKPLCCTAPRCRHFGNGPRHLSSARYLGTRRSRICCRGRGSSRRCGTCGSLVRGRSLLSAGVLQRKERRHNTPFTYLQWAETRRGRPALSCSVAPPSAQVGIKDGRVGERRPQEPWNLSSSPMRSGS